MTKIEKASTNLKLNDTSKKEECSHELDMNDENEHLTVIDSVSVQTELEQLFNEFTNYNHHIKVFKKLLNLKELNNQLNFFAFNKRKQSANINDLSNDDTICCATLSASSTSKQSSDLSSTLFKGEKGELLSSMQVHSQLENIREQFIESQLLVTCLIHNLQRLRKHYCGQALDLVSSSELLASLEKDHNALKTCKSIFQYQCLEKRKQLNKLKQQLKKAHDDWNQLIVREPKITKLTNEELSLLNKSKRRSKSIENQLTSRQLSDKQVDDKQEQLNSSDLSSSTSSSSTSIEASNKSKVVVNGNQETGESNCDSAVHSESEADSLQELAAAIYRRKSKLDRLERECFSFMSRLANRNRTLDSNQVDQSNLEQLDDELNDYQNDQYEDSNLIIGRLYSDISIYKKNELNYNFLSISK